MKFTNDNIHFIPSAGEDNTEINGEDQTAAYLRTFYNTVYQSGEMGDTMTAGQGLLKAAFPAKPMYLVIDGEPVMSDPEKEIAIVNNTPGRIKVDVFSAGNLANVVVGADEVQGFKVPSNLVTDMMLTFDTTVNLATKSPPPTEGFSYIHVDSRLNRNLHDVQFTSNTYIKLMPFTKSEVRWKHLVITIDTRDGKYYYTIGGEMRLMDYKAFVESKTTGVVVN